MSKQSSDERVFAEARNASDLADHDEAMGENIRHLIKRRRFSEKSTASLPVSDDFYPPSRPRRGCEDC